MDTVTIPYGEDAAATARELLELAGDDADQVRTSTDGFVVPEELAARWPGREGRGRAQVDDGDYDPAKYSAAEVTDYLETAGDDERQRVIQAEADGKNRKTIAEWQPAPGSGDDEGA